MCKYEDDISQNLQSLSPYEPGLPTIYLFLRIMVSKSSHEVSWHKRVNWHYPIDVNQSILFNRNGNFHQRNLNFPIIHHNYHYLQIMWEETAIRRSSKPDVSALKPTKNICDLHESPYSVRIEENADQKKLRICKFFAECSNETEWLDHLIMCDHFISPFEVYPGHIQVRFSPFCCSW